MCKRGVLGFCSLRASGIRLALRGRWPLGDQTLNRFCHAAKQTPLCNFQSGLALQSTARPSLLCTAFAPLRTACSLCITCSPLLPPAAFSDCDEHGPQRDLLLPERGDRHDPSLCLSVCPLSGVSDVPCVLGVLDTIQIRTSL